MILKFKLLSFALLLTLCTSAQDWKTYPYNPPGSQVSFSLDEGHHASEPIEWWYTAGHITVENSEKTYTYMLTYFYYPASIFDGFRILTISDDATDTFYQDTQPLNYTTLSTTQLDIEASLFFGGTEAWTNKLDALNAIIPFEYTLSAFASFGSLNLEYETLKRPLILGDDGYLNQGDTNYTYYYSQTKNAVLGSLTLNGITENVTGTAWIDRQYGDFNPITSEKYEWFSMQLSNGMDINLWNIFTNERAIPSNEAYRILSAYVNETSQYTSSDFQIERLGFNWMPDNAKCYSSQWRLSSPVNDLDLTITTMHDNTEVQLPFRFFEGSTTITGTVNGVAVTGLGFAELLHSYENPEVTMLSPSGGVYDVSMPIVWQLNNPDEGRPIYYDLEYSIDNQQNFTPIIQGLTDTSYVWNANVLNENDEVWFKIVAYSIDGVLSNTIISTSSSSTTLSLVEMNKLEISFYPNPVIDTMILNAPESLGQALFKIFDINGNLIKEFQLGSNENEVNLKFLSSGIYFLTSEHKDLKSTLRFVKQ